MARSKEVKQRIHKNRWERRLRWKAYKGTPRRDAVRMHDERFCGSFFPTTVVVIPR